MASPSSVLKFPTVGAEATLSSQECIDQHPGEVAK